MRNTQSVYAYTTVRLLLLAQADYTVLLLLLLLLLLLGSAAILTLQLKRSVRCTMHSTVKQFRSVYGAAAVASVAASSFLLPKARAHIDFSRFAAALMLFLTIVCILVCSQVGVQCTAMCDIAV
jgi:hypothetical protein